MLVLGGYFTWPKQPRGAQDEIMFLKSLLPARHPELYLGTLEEAIQRAKTLKKFIVIYLHSSIHQDAQNFVDKVFCNEAIVELLDRNYIVWAGDVSLPTAYRASLKLAIDGFPAFGVYSAQTFVPRSHLTILDEARVHLPYELYKFRDVSNMVDPDEVLGMLTGILEQYGPWITAVERAAREAEANRQLMEDQDAAYYEAVRADEELARREEERLEAERIERQREEEAALAEQRREEEAALAERLRMEEEMRVQELAAVALEREREIAAQRLASEPAADHPDAVQITFRAVDSSRVTRRFYKDDTVRTLYDFARTIETTPADFSLAIPFPRRTLSDLESKLGDLNINKALLNIEPL